MEVLREGYRFPFLRPPPLSTDPIPMPSYAPTQRGCSRGGHPGVDCQGCCGACSSSLSRLFQPPVCGLEVLGVVASSHRPVPAHSLRGHFALSHGDHPVCSHVSLAGGLDGLHRPSGGVSPQPHWSSLGIWLLYRLFFIPWVSVCVVTWTTGSSRHRPGRLSSGFSGLSCPFVMS